MFFRVTSIDWYTLDEITFELPNLDLLGTRSNEYAWAMMYDLEYAE